MPVSYTHLDVYKRQQLGGRYTVGTYLSADGDGLAYRGVLNEEKKFVLLKEYFPVTLCNGRSAAGALMPKEEKEVLFKTCLLYTSRCV